MTTRLFLNRSLSAVIFAVGLLGCCVESVRAQPVPANDSNVLLELEIVTPRQGTNLLAAQRWGSFFRDEGEVVRVREPLADDKPAATETPRGTFRIVKVLAVMDREGQLHVPGQRFQLSQPEQVRQWLRDLKTYGAQGNPEGQPRWGLNDQQFKEVFAALSVDVADAVAGRTFPEALKSLPVPATYPLRIHPDAAPLVEGLATELIQDEVQGLSLGTALAGTLVQHGLGFRPRRTPAGELELVVESLTVITDPWPVGWEVDRSERNTVAPKLFQPIAAGFENQPLQDVIQAISTQQEVPVICARAACLTHEIDLASPVSYPMKSVTMWAMVLESSVRQVKLDMHIRSDEVGRPVVFVTPFLPKRPGQK